MRRLPRLFTHLAALARVCSKKGLLVACITCTSGRLFSASFAFGETPLNPLTRIAWTAPETCPDESTVRAAIQTMTGPLSLREHGPDLVASGIVSAEGERFTLRLRIESKGTFETKTIDAESCATLADAYAVTVAFALDPGAAVRPPEIEQPTVPATRIYPPSHVEPVVPPAAPSATAFAARPRRPSPAPPPEVALGPLALVAAGLLPFPAFGVGARIAVQAGLRWELAGTYWPDKAASVSVDAARVVGARVGLFTVEPSVCQSLWREALTLCVGGDVGSIHATGMGAGVTAHSGASWWLAPKAAAGVRLRLAPSVDLRFRFDIGAPLFRPTFYLDNVGPSRVNAYQPGPVFAVVSLEPEIRFFTTDSVGERHGSK